MDRLDLIRLHIKENPNDPFLQYALAKEFEKNQNPRAALEQYQKLMVQFPDYLGTYYHYASLLVDQQQTERALEISQLGIQVAERQQDEHSKSELISLRMNIETG